jgi:CRISPR-associated protein Cas5d
MGYGIKVRVSGQRACFTRPEMHAERVSYDVITPSAARGVLEAVYWKPAIRWVIDGITVLNPIKFDTIRRNEVASKASYRNAKTVMATGHGALGIDVTADRQQRNTLYLVDVDYLVDAHFEIDQEKAGDSDSEAKHYNIALRRLRSGQCFNQPYLGCREFPATVSLMEEGEPVPKSFYAGEEERDLGFMLYDLDFSDPAAPTPLFFRAVMRNGFIDVRRARAEVIS